jgi:hypothetical protein
MEPKSSNRNWEVTIMEFQEAGKKRFKVSRRYPRFSIAETKIFSSKARAKLQFERWLG